MRRTNKLSLVGLLGTIAITLAGCAADDVADPTVMVEPETDNISPMAPTNPCPKRPTMAVDGPLGTSGASNIADGCDWFIVSGPLANQPHPAPYTVTVDTKTLDEQRIVVQTKALCESSWVEAEVHGERGPYYTYEPGPVYHPAVNEWVLLATRREHGTWYNGKCRFMKAEAQCGVGAGNGCSVLVYNNPANPNYNAMDSILIATRSRVYGLLGPTTVSMRGSYY